MGTATKRIVRAKLATNPPVAKIPTAAWRDGLPHTIRGLPLQQQHLSLQEQANRDAYAMWLLYIAWAGRWFRWLS